MKTKPVWSHLSLLLIFISSLLFSMGCSKDVGKKLPSKGGTWNIESIVAEFENGDLFSDEQRHYQFIFEDDGEITVVQEYGDLSGSWSYSENAEELRLPELDLAYDMAPFMSTDTWWAVLENGSRKLTLETTVVQQQFGERGTATMVMKRE